MKILITGGAGFIGTWTVEALAGRGHDVTILDSFSAQVHGNDENRAALWSAAHPEVRTVVGDVCDRQLIGDLAPGFDAILHLAAETGTGQSMYDIAHYNSVNVGGTANLLEAVSNGADSRIRRLVVASSRSIYGEGRYACVRDGDVYPVERDANDLAEGRFEPRCPQCGEAVEVRSTPEHAQLLPASVYAVTKLAQEMLVLAVARARGIGAYALRYQNVYGAGQSLSNPYTGILSIFSREMLAGRPIEIFEDGAESRDFVHVSDVARVNVLALESDAAGAASINVGVGEPTSVLQIAHSLARRYGFTGAIEISGRFRAGDIRHNYADLQRLRDTIGFVPQVSLADGLASFADWVATSQLNQTSDSYRASLGELEQRGLIAGGRAGTR